MKRQNKVQLLNLQRLLFQRLFQLSLRKLKLKQLNLLVIKKIRQLSQLLKLLIHFKNSYHFLMKILILLSLLDKFMFHLMSLMIYLNINTSFSKMRRLPTASSKLTLQLKLMRYFKRLKNTLQLFCLA